MRNMWISIRMFLCLSFLTGLLYPFVITFITQTAMTEKANGSFLIVNDKKIGSKLIAQKFTSDKYFWGRPSSIDYNPLPSGGSNLGPTSAALRKVVDERRQTLMKAHGVVLPGEIPAELLFASGSGLDPHISLKTAVFQIDRIAKARNLSRKNIENLKVLVQNLITGKSFGLLGKSYINVLELNLALDQLTQANIK